MKFLTYYSRPETWRDVIKQHLVNRYAGFYNDQASQRWLEPNADIGNHCGFQTACAPPARHYFDESYVTCIVETCHRNHNSILFSEKTYDHLIQGRAVMNFATPGFYQQLSADGWALPSGIDWSWDLITDDEQRLDAYLAELDKLLGKSMHDLHQWFLDNLSVWEHNQLMLKTKPYDIIDFGSF